MRSIGGAVALCESIKYFGVMCPVAALYECFVYHLVIHLVAEMSKMSSVSATEGVFLMPFAVSISQHNQG